jgi:hypothetical protein
MMSFDRTTFVTFLRGDGYQYACLDAVRDIPLGFTQNSLPQSRNALNLLILRVLENHLELLGDGMNPDDSYP